MKTVREAVRGLEVFCIVAFFFLFVHLCVSLDEPQVSFQEGMAQIEAVFMLVLVIAALEYVLDEWVILKTSTSKARIGLFAATFLGIPLLFLGNNVVKSMVVAVLFISYTPFIAFTVAQFCIRKGYCKSLWGGIEK